MRYMFSYYFILGLSIGSASRSSSKKTDVLPYLEHLGPKGAP